MLTKNGATIDESRKFKTSCVGSMWVGERVPENLKCPRAASVCELCHTLFCHRPRSIHKWSSDPFPLVWSRDSIRSFTANIWWMTKKGWLWKSEKGGRKGTVGVWFRSIQVIENSWRNHFQLIREKSEFGACGKRGGALWKCGLLGNRDRGRVVDFGWDGVFLKKQWRAQATAGKQMWMIPQFRVDCLHFPGFWQKFLHQGL